MSDFKAKMYQIQFRLGLRPRPPSWIKGIYTYQFFIVDNVNSKELSIELVLSAALSNVENIGQCRRLSQLSWLLSAL